MTISFRKIATSILICSVVSITAGCETGSNNELFSKQNIGTVAGAAGGAVLGSNVGKGKGNIAAIAAGTLLGGLAGNKIGASLDRADMTHYNRSSQQALETAQTNTPVTWRNPDSGNSGTITPTRTFQTSDGTYCREYTQKIVVQGKPAQGYGKACRQADGTWKISE
jgi:surface antigen